MNKRYNDILYEFIDPNIYSDPHKIYDIKKS